MTSSVWEVPLFPCETREQVVTDFAHVKIKVLPKGNSNCFWYSCKI